MNFEIASEILDLEHLSLIISDEAVFLQSDDSVNRRGMAGTVIVEKMVGALAETGTDLTTCCRLGQRVVQRHFSFPVKLVSPHTHMTWPTTNVI